jgi:alpha-L-rhamnosidase
VTSPENTTGQIALPTLSGERTIAMDGRIVWRDGRPADGVRAHQDGERLVFDGVQGDHTFAWS